MGDVNSQIAEYMEKGWKAEGLDRADEGYIVTPEGDIFQYHDLLEGVCPVCAPLEPGEEEHDELRWCDGTGHDEKILQRVREAEQLVKLIDERARRQLVKLLG